MKYKIKVPRIGIFDLHSLENVLHIYTMPKPKYWTFLCLEPLQNIQKSIVRVKLAIKHKYYTSTNLLQNAVKMMHGEKHTSTHFVYTFSFTLCRLTVSAISLHHI